MSFLYTLYGKLKDPVSGLTHLLGALLGAVGGVMLVRRSLASGGWKEIAGFSIFSISVVLLYLSSAVYHLLKVSDKARAVFRQIDHAMIFVLIAGSYTPFCLISLPPNVGMPLLVGVWVLAIGGLLINIFWMHAPRWLTTCFYLFLGWMALTVIVPLSHTLSSAGLQWLVAGGLFYSFGAIIYGVKKPNPFPPHFGFHEIWHLFVLGGSVCHFFSVATLVSA